MLRAARTVGLHSSTAVMVVLTVMAIILRLRYFAGCVSSDDLRHAWGGYFFWENLHQPFIQYHGIIASMRVGVDFLLWLSFMVFGPHEWSAGLVPFTFSLLGIWGIYLLGRRVGGELAGLAAAAFLSFLPLDIYLAGMWLPDTILSTLVIASVIWFMRSLEADCRCSAIGWGILSGAALGYGFLVKEIAPMVLVAFLLWSALTIRSDRRALRVGWVVVGCAVLMALGAAYWYKVAGDPLFNIKRIYAAQQLVHRLPVTARSMLLGFPLLLVRNPVFGPALLLTPFFLVVFAVGRRVRYRALVLVLFAVLWLSLMKAGQMEVNLRYLMLVAAPVIVVAAVAVAVIASRLPRVVGSVLVALATSSTLLGLAAGHQPWTHAGAQPLRAINTIVQLADIPDDPVFADPRVLLILYQLNGFRPYAGGLYRYPTSMPEDRRAVWHDPFAPAFDTRYGVAPDGLELSQRQRGWVVFHERYANKFDKDYWRLPLPQALWHPPPNWVRVAGYAERWTGAEVSLYLIRPAELVFRELPLAELSSALTPWDQGAADHAVGVSPDGITSSATFAGGGFAQQRYAGVRLRVDARALRLRLRFVNTDQIAALYVRAQGPGGREIIWRAAGRDLPRTTELEATFAPGEAQDPFVQTKGDAGAVMGLAEIFFQPKPGSASAGFTISRVEVAH